MKSLKKNKVSTVYKKDGQDRLLPKLSLKIFDHSRTAAIIWLCVTIFGVFSYTVFMKREGFPSINIPYSVASGAYLVNDAQKVDAEVAKPLSDIILADDRVKSAQTQAYSNFYSVVVQYNEGVDAAATSGEIEQKIKAQNVLPTEATLAMQSPKFGFTERGDDAVISVYATQPGITTEQLTAQGSELSKQIAAQQLPGVESVSVIDPYITGVNPLTGAEAQVQTKFDRFGQRQNDQTQFYNSVSVGVTQKKNTDVIQLDDDLQRVVANYNQQSQASGISAFVSAGYANDIKVQISELQMALLEGLLAILVIGSVIIAIRASLITVLAMLTVLAITLGVLFVVGYTLNTITLFSLILCLGLIVDDTIIMVEAIDAQRRKRKDPRETIHVATQKVSRAMVAATSTAALSFAPLLFVGGILGSFIRAIPVTVITSLVVSLLVALIFIPLFARYLLLGKKQMGAENVNEPASVIESKIAQFIARPMVWAKHSRKRIIGVGSVALFIGFGFVIAGGMLFQKVTFNIFPPSKDSNGLTAAVVFAPETTISEAEAIADKVDDTVAQTVGDNFKTASYFSSGSATNANLTINLIPYDERDVRAPELQEQLQAALKNIDGAKVKVQQLDVGPPPSAFTVRIHTNDRDAGMRLAQDLNTFLLNRELVRPSGTIATINETAISDPSGYQRTDGDAYLEVTANFDASDTTTLVTLAQTAVEGEFTEAKLASYGLNKDALKFDFGQEDENQESFKALALAFPALLFAIYLLLAFQFRSLAQPLLIFMAIPFSLFGITLGLYLTDNAFSFFAMLGFFALIGLSIKNTILLTDYANQLRRKGVSPIDAAVGALGERFRPLIATSLTAVVSLIPLALSSPFWEGLAVVLIFGLLSSTTLVILVFPYYYLGAEFVRFRVSFLACVTWFALSIALILAIVALKAPTVLAVLSPVIVVFGQIAILGRFKKHKNKK